MVFLTASKRITSLIGSPLLRFGLAARSWLPIGNNSNLPSSVQQQQLAPSFADTPYLDMALLIPFSQKLLSLALYDESQKKVSEYYAQQNKDDSNSDGMLESLISSQQTTRDNPDDSEAIMQDISNLRIQAYNQVIRKTLLPFESKSNLQAWMGHTRLLKWARAEFLIAKHGPMVKEAMNAYPLLRNSPQFQRNPKHNFVLQLARGRLVLPSASQTNENHSKLLLPTTETITKALNLKDWATTKNSQALMESTLETHNIIFGNDNNNNDSLEDVSTEALLDCLSGGHVQSCGPLNAICEEANLYQLWTQEYVQHLGDYLLQEYAGRPNTTIVDIGAGDGLLIRYLQDYMQGKLDKVAKRGGRKKKQSATMPTMISTDDGSWGIFAKAKVEKLNVQAALQKYGKKQNEQDETLVVLCSWMPQQVDWTEQFRKAQVDEYILIGEADDGSCGHGWNTWGNPVFAPTPSEEEEEDSDPIVPPFEQDGYRRWDMDSLVPFQFSRFDSAISRSSLTVSFRRRTRSVGKGAKR